MTTHYSVKLTGEARDALRAVSLRLGPVIGRPITYSEALVASLAVSEAHPADVADAVRAGGASK